MNYPELQRTVTRPSGKVFTWEQDLREMLYNKRDEEILKMVNWMLKEVKKEGVK